MVGGGSRVRVSVRLRYILSILFSVSRPTGTIGGQRHRVVRTTRRGARVSSARRDPPRAGSQNLIENAIPVTLEMASPPSGSESSRQPLRRLGSRGESRVCVSDVGRGHAKETRLRKTLSAAFALRKQASVFFLFPKCRAESVSIALDYFRS